MELMEHQECQVLKDVMVPLVVEDCLAHPEKTDSLVALEIKEHLVPLEILEETELTDSRDQKETLVLLVSLESEVPLVVPDKEKKVSPADQDNWKGCLESMEPKERLENLAEVVFLVVRELKENVVLQDETDKREKMGETASQDGPA